MSNIAIPKMVVFDLYGTLIKFGVMHHPFRQLLKWARDQGRSVDENDARRLMTINSDFFELPLHLGIHAPQELLTQLKLQIEEELASLSLYDDVIPTLHALQQRHIPVAICSNLAQPYGEIIDRLLPQFNFRRYLSYEIGFIKPDEQIYQNIVEDAGVSCDEILFVGDTFEADYVGPIKSGFKAFHLTRNQPKQNHTIVNLKETISLFR